ncbi:MAG TPA: Zn-dependent hydrolase [Solirubrobacteraceae bacterium]|nr:Zn-dependent hydrolase [Solirubrobacteraceae bacterium]
MSLSERLSALDGIGVRPEGVVRLAWTAEDAACREWFRAQASEVGLRVEVDPAGNMWACPDAESPWFGAGSHLDSVRGGGRFDGPLGVACGFELAALSELPVAVISFADEEGARFNTPTFGSKALSARLDLPAVLERRDGDGVALGDALMAFGVDPGRIAEAPPWLERLSGFLEIHIDQSTDVARAGVPVGIVSSLANRMRLEVEVDGRADHAGTTPREEREDAMLGAARLIVAADATASELGGLTVTTSRLVAEPNAPTTIASLVRLWIDARSVDNERLDAWLDRVRDVDVGARVRIGVASRSAGREFAPELRGQLARAGEAVLGQSPPEVVCFAGHDAGVVGERVPSSMLLVRNETGVSHAPEEHVELADAAAAVRVAARMLR